MANVQVLDNRTIHHLLINLSKEETVAFRQTIEQTFEDFSVGGERHYQPMPGTVNRANGQNTLFRPFTSDSCIGAKITVEPAPEPDGTKDPLHGILVLCDGKGNPTGILSAEEVTGYRTSMNAMVPFSWRKHVDSIVIFGSGMQALWHTRLILALRGSEVKTITYVNPGKDALDNLIATVSMENETLWKSSCSFHFIDITASGFQQKVEASVSDADCIFCTTPSKTPLFPSSYLSKERRRQPFISAIGSWQPSMIEIDPSLLHDGITAKDGYNPVTGEAKGVILVDDRDFGLGNCGELVQSRLAAKDCVELGEIIALRKGKGRPELLTKEHVKKRNQYISEGFIIYKSVGVSLTDLTASNAVLDLSNKRRQQHL